MLSMLIKKIPVLTSMSLDEREERGAFAEDWNAKSPHCEASPPAGGDRQSQPAHPMAPSVSPVPPMTREDANKLETHTERNMFSGKPSPLGEVSFPRRRSTARCLKPPQGNGPGRSRLDDLYPHGLFDRGDVFGCYNRGRWPGATST